MFDFLLEGGRDDDLCPLGELYLFGLCWSLHFSGDRLVMKVVSSNPTVCRRFDVSVTEQNVNFNACLKVYGTLKILFHSAPL